MIRIILVSIFCLMLTSAQAETFNGESGKPATPPTSSGTPAPQAVPPVMKDVEAVNTPAPPTVPAPQSPAPAAANAEKPKADPCAAYLMNYAYYAACTDRIQKIERMKEAQARRIKEADQTAETPADKKTDPAMNAANNAASGTGTTNSTNKDATKDSGATGKQPGKLETVFDLHKRRRAESGN